MLSGLRVGGFFLTINDYIELWMHDLPFISIKANDIYNCEKLVTRRRTN